MINRMIREEMKKTRKSVLLQGLRQVGKSTLTQSLNPDLEINLADELEYLKYSGNPESFRDKVESGDYKTIYIMLVPIIWTEKSKK